MGFTGSMPANNPFMGYSATKSRSRKLDKRALCPLLSLGFVVAILVPNT